MTARIRVLTQYLVILLVLSNKSFSKPIYLLSSQNPYETHTNTHDLLACPSFRGTLKDPTQKSPNTSGL